jgi:hypothetical protein
MEISVNLRNVEFLRDGEQVELGYMPMETTVVPDQAAPVRFGRNVKIGRNVKVSPYNHPGA